MKRIRSSRRRKLKIIYEKSIASPQPLSTPASLPTTTTWKIRWIIKLKRSNFKNCCVVTHNVFIRVLIGKSFNIDKKDWFKIDIPHLLELDFLLIDGKLFPNISRSVLKVLFSNLTQ